MKKMKLILAAAALAFSGMANATVMTVTTSGTISYGHDYLGLFGAVGRNLVNLPYLLTVSVELDRPNNYSTKPGQYIVTDTNEPVIAAATVDGARYAIQLDHFVLSRASVNAQTGVSFTHNGQDASGGGANIAQKISEAVPTVSLTDYQNLPVQGVASSLFTVTIGTETTTFQDFSPSTFVMNGDPATLAPPAPSLPADPVPTPAPVPEPASAFLFGTGLLSVALLGRRRCR